MFFFCLYICVKMTQEPNYLLATLTGKPKKVFTYLTVISANILYMLMTEIS